VAMVFDRWSTEGIEIRDPTIEQVIALDKYSLPHTFGRHAKKRFAKTRIGIVERLVNKLMRGGTGEKVGGRVIRTHGRRQGKKVKMMHTVERAFEIIEEKTGKNPIQVLVDAIINTGPIEDTTRVKMGGISYQISVDVSPIRRVDMALRNIVLAAIMRSFNAKRSLAETLADEIIAAANNDIQNSYAVKRRDEIERIAKSAR